MPRIGFDLAAQAADLHVDAAVERHRAASTRQVEQLVARQGALRMLDEREQQFEFAGRQRDQRAFRRQQSAPADVERPAGKVHEPLCGVVRPPRGRGRAAQQRPHARQQFTRIEGLRQVVVGADFQADDAVGLFA